jgi:hypothetical protein
MQVIQTTLFPDHGMCLAYVIKSHHIYSGLHSTEHYLCKH